MGRYKKLIFIITVIILITVSMTLFKKDNNKVSINVKKNEIIIDNFEMAKVVDKEDNYYRINAKRAVMNRKARIADLTDFVLNYKKGDTDFTAKADRGVLVDEVKVDVSGKITGTINTLSYATDKDGKFHYDFDTDIGVLTGNVVVKDKEGTILADKVIIYHKKNIVEFDGDVKVLYKN